MQEDERKKKDKHEAETGQGNMTTQVGPIQKKKKKRKPHVGLELPNGQERHVFRTER